MPYNSNISRSDAGALIPEEAAREIISHMPQTSAVMSLARRLPDMARNQRRMPVVSALPTAYWINPGSGGGAADTGLKQTTEVNWDNVYLNAEELAVIVPIPDAVADDADYDLWGLVRQLLPEAFGLEFDRAVLRGTNAPTAFPDDIVTAATAASHVVSLAAKTDLYEALFDVGGVYNLVEADGYMVSGHIAELGMMARLRGNRDANGQPIFSQGMVDGVPFYSLGGQRMMFPTNGSMAGSAQLLITGDWSQLVWSLRQDITYKILDQAVIQDNTGAIVYNLAQQDMKALRAVMRIGWALPNPVNRTNSNSATRYPFAVLTA